ncbi:predicted protein [Thalassiosira pseudonana CCMP1335]|uniref:UBZ4-type domain-containing protein n=1 Tax=Thalassiosira pseudonana TaxID=35128 RepID=B8C1K7_THAPS|nr:predicted protein [Thalassiosira pseudonana CCMP1335]EED91786.1 predicted protein [Thalassiosira pseudonana CCMP1335]
MSNNANTTNNALDHLMSHAKTKKKKRKRPSPATSGAHQSTTTSSGTPSLTSPDGASSSQFFPCPVGCGRHVTERNVNEHLDKCLGDGGDDAADDDSNAASDDGQRDDVNVDWDGGISSNEKDDEEAKATSSEPMANPDTSNTSLPSLNTQAKQLRSDPNNKATNNNNNNKSAAIADTSNAFAHMMQHSAKVFSKAATTSSMESVRHRFHLHSVDGLVSWTEEDDRDIVGLSGSDVENGAKAKDVDSSSAIDISDVQWSVTITVKKVKTIQFKRTTSEDNDLQQQRSNTNQSANSQSERPLELIVSTSIPFPQQEGKKRGNFVRRHSRLSVAQLKSCLQKSIRRRAPLPAVRVALELVDKSWEALIRRLPIICLEDSFLHPDFALLVWLMVADSKNYAPPTSLIVRVMQIVFEMASCPRQDICIESYGDMSGMIWSFSMSTPSSQLLPSKLRSPSLDNAGTVIRTMLLRAQYGGMACDVQMLNSFAKTWLKRFHEKVVPAPLASSLVSLDANNQASINCEVLWWDVPRLLHSKSRGLDFWLREAMCLELQFRRQSQTAFVWRGCTKQQEHGGCYFGGDMG